MNAREIFDAYKEALSVSWTEAIFATYPFETKGFLRTIQDKFSNPVAHMTREAAKTLYDVVAGGDCEPETVKAALDRFVKLRAVQDFTPSQGLGVLLLMKPLLREKVLPEFQKHNMLDAYLEAESRLDSLCLLAFDMYVQAREVIAQNRINETKNRYAQLERWAQQLEQGN